MNIGYFVKEKLMLAFNGECKFVNQTISGTNFSGIVLSQGNFGLMMGYNFLGMARIQIYPNVSANYSVGKLYRIASSENGTYNSVEIKEHVEKMNNGKIVNGFSNDAGIRIMFFPISGRVFGYICPRVQYSYLSYKKDSGFYSNNLNVMTFTLQLGAGYITE